MSGVKCVVLVSSVVTNILTLKWDKKKSIQTHGQVSRKSYFDIWDF